jgi:hypothetical protein
MAAAERLWRFLKDENDFESVPFDESQARAALAAFDRYAAKPRRIASLHVGHHDGDLLVRENCMPSRS